MNSKQFTRRQLARPLQLRTRRSWLVAIMAVVTAMLVLTGCSATPTMMAQPLLESGSVMLPSIQKKSKVEVIKVDVVDNPHLFVFDEAPVHEDGTPAHGNTFITQGYIYPHGTLNGSNGVLPNGEPEFPDKVLGTWICRGWVIGDGAHATAGAMAFTTQFFDFGEEYDHATLVTEGYEVVDVNQPFARAITGGTDRFMHARGEAIQELLGYTEQMAVNLRFELRISE